MIFTEFSPLTPESGLQHVVANVLREVPVDADSRLLRSAFIVSISSDLVAGARGLRQPAVDGRPFLLRQQRHEELGVVEPGGIGAVVGTPDLR